MLTSIAASKLKSKLKRHKSAVQNAKKNKADKANQDNKKPKKNQIANDELNSKADLEKNTKANMQSSSNQAWDNIIPQSSKSKI